MFESSSFVCFTDNTGFMELIKRVVFFFAESKRRKLISKLDRGA